MTIDELSTLRTGLGTTTETRIGASRNTCEIDDKNWIKEQFISSQIFHRTPRGRVQKITVREQFESQILKSDTGFTCTNQEQESIGSNITKRAQLLDVPTAETKQ
jgi:hypothetical protein